jgi:hypothetical protein
MEQYIPLDNNGNTNICKALVLPKAFVTTGRHLTDAWCCSLNLGLFERRPWGPEHLTYDATDEVQV